MNLIFRIFSFILKVRIKMKNEINKKLIGFKSCGEGMNINTPYTIKGAKNIVIGKNFSSMGNLYLYGNDGWISIGNNVSLNTNVQVGSSHSKITIGNNVLIGPNVVLRAADHDFSDKNNLINKQGHIGSEIVIEDDVWIGSNVVITKGVKIKKGSVVGAGSVVNKNVEEYTIVAGVPAKEIGKR